MSRRMTMFIWIQLNFLLVFMCIEDVRGWEQCPSLKNASPCRTSSCKEVDNITKLKLFCFNLPQSFNFHKIFSHSEDKIEVEALRIINLQITNFTKAMFNYKPLREISISQADIISLPKDAFEGTSLEYLSLIECGLTDATDNVGNIRFIPKLKSLYLTGNHFEIVKWSWFKASSLKKTLVSLALKKNKIYLIEDNAFHTLTNLEYLDLSHNNIQTLKRNFFPDKLDALSLGYNKIEKLPGGLFDGMYHLRFLRLESNRIKELKKDVFDDMLRHSTVVDLRGNPIHCGCYLDWMMRDGRKPAKFYGECDSPEVLRKKALTGITDDDIHCEYSQTND